MQDVAFIAHADELERIAGRIGEVDRRMSRRSAIALCPHLVLRASAGTIRIVPLDRVVPVGRSTHDVATVAAADVGC